MSEGSKQGSSSGSADSYKFTDATKSPTNVTVGALASGTNITDQEVRDLVGAMVWEYPTPSISSASSTTSQSQVCYNEIGTALTFNFTLQNAAQVAANSLRVIDVTSGNIVIAEGRDPSLLTVSVTLASAIYKTAHYASHVFQLEITDTNGDKHTRNVTFRWYMPMFYGKDPQNVLVEADLNNLTQDNNEYDANLNVTYPDSSPTVEYAYLIVHSSLAPLDSGTDVGTGFAWAFVNTGTDANYNLTNVNGLNYYTLSVTVGTDNPTVETYHVYRSLNAFAGAKTVNYDI